MFAAVVSAQTTEFTYQGRLTSSGTSVNQPHDFEFRLCRDVTCGDVLATNQRLNVTVTNGIFTVTLDFGANFYQGDQKYLEIALKPAGSSAPFTVLTPRQKFTSAPTAIRSFNAVNAENALTANNSQQLGGVPASQFVLTGDARLADARNPLPNSPNYINNSTTQQASSNFNISGNGRIGGALSANSVSVGNILSANTISADNVTSEVVKAFFQYDLRNYRVMHDGGFLDSLYIGYNAGNSIPPDNTIATNNTFVGSFSGQLNTFGQSNSFFGASSGLENTTGSRNSFFGDSSGLNNNIGSRNTFFGYTAGTSNNSGNNNTLIGYSANVSQPNLNFATAIGANSRATLSNQIVLGRPSGEDDVYIYGNLHLSSLGSGGSQAICRAGVIISTCSSSIRYKTNVNSFTGGLETVRRLRPVTFDWKSNNERDVGFVAEEIKEIEPLLATYNDKGEVEGVKYAQVTTVLVNAVNEQQKQIEDQKQTIERQQKQVEEQQKQIDALKKSVCAINPAAEICKEK